MTQTAREYVNKYVKDKTKGKKISRKEMTKIMKDAWKEWRKQK